MVTYGGQSFGPSGKPEDAKTALRWMFAIFGVIFVVCGIAGDETMPYVVGGFCFILSYVWRYVD